MTIRLSLGAGRPRLVRQLVIEGLVLSVIAGAGGLVVAYALRDAVAFLTPPRGGVLLRLPDANVAPSELITMREQVERTTAAQRISVTMLIVFGGLALLLAAIGLYGVMASSVSQRTRELALRTALGANASALLRLVLTTGVALTAGGVALGLLVALRATRLLGYLRFNVSPLDPRAFGSAAIVITLASVAACVGPAWRATRTDPLGALRG
jgi:ABC-type antimicrobial peptide transport system permease subunit